MLKVYEHVIRQINSPLTKSKLFTENRFDRLAAPRTKNHILNRQRDTDMSVLLTPLINMYAVLFGLNRFLKPAQSHRTKFRARK